MVKFRGINIHAVSQIEARRLPEYNTVQAVDANSPVSACCIPTIPGAQIWFEYSIDGPHPPNAMYLFKLCIDGQHITTWDCTAKHIYHGKIAYSLHVVKSGHCGGRAVVQNSLIFSNTNVGLSPDTNDDCIEIRVHRIQRRRRIRQLALDTPIPKRLHGRGPSAVRLADAGLIEPDRPARRYQYLLLDPQDGPYAAFRFYCRTREYLARHQVLHVDRSLSPTSLATSSNYFDPESPLWRQVGGTDAVHSPTKSPWSSPQSCALGASSEHSLGSAFFEKEICIPQSPTSTNIKGSIEDLPSIVPRSPHATGSPRRLSLKPFDGQSELSPTQKSSPLLSELDGLGIGRVESPTLPVPSDQDIHLAASSCDSDPASLSGISSLRLPYHRHKPSTLKSAPDGDSFDLDRQPPRPLSPFTRAGFLRRFTYREARHTPPRPRAASAEPVVATQNIDKKRAEATGGGGKEEQDDGPTDEVRKTQNRGHPFLGFLGRSPDRRSAT